MQCNAFLFWHYAITKFKDNILYYVMSLLLSSLTSMLPGHVFEGLTCEYVKFFVPNLDVDMTFQNMLKFTL